MPDNVGTDHVGTDNGFFAGFLDEYFAECDEHLTLVRRALLSLENCVNQPHVNRTLLDDLFRSFHSLKGISGMVGVRAAEQLAHELESYLRHLRQDQVVLSPAGMDALMAGTRVLEAVISAHHQQAAPPEIAPVLQQLAAVLSDLAPLVAAGALVKAPAIRSLQKGLSAEEEAQVEAARTAGWRVWRFAFTPAPALVARGVNVNSVRARLQEIGDLIHAAPQVLEQGGITFLFIVASQAEEATFAAWQTDGIAYRLYDDPAEAELVTPDADSPAVVPAPTAAARPSAHVVRVELERLDELMRMVGELVISRAQLENKLKRVEGVLPPADWRALQETHHTMARQLRDLREGIMQTRMVPVGEIFERMQFVIRDLARESGKRVRLELHGQETELDKYLVERMMDPLLHLVRNAFSHGLESVAERLAAGKAAEGQLWLRAFTAGETVVLEIEDDGRGIDAAWVAERGQLAGLAPAGVTLDDDALLELLCAPGFSTRAEADRASGRGIGMAVVQQTLLALGGTLTLQTQVGAGTRFTLELPLTLAIAEVLIARVAEQVFAIPQAAVREVLEIEPAAIRVLENNELIQYRDGVLPLLRLTRFFGLAEQPSRALYAFVVGSGANLVGLVVDRILGQREIVVRALADPLVQVPGVAGATELGDGRAVLLLDAMALVKCATGARRFAQSQRHRETAGSASPVRRWPANATGGESAH